MSRTVEALVIRVTIPHAKPVFVAIVYRPPSAPVAWYGVFDDFMDRLCAQECELVVMGDMNIDILDGLNTAPSVWQDTIDGHQLTQIVRDPTRVTADTQTLIDHIYVSHPGNVKACKVSTIALSDHYPVCFVRHLRANYDRKHGHTTIKYRSYKNFDEKAFLADLEVVPWSVIEQFDDVDDALDTWEKLFMEVVNMHAPLRERRVKRPRQPGWLTEDITEAMDKRDSLKQSRDFPNYKLWRNKVVRMLKEAKADYYMNLIEENRRDTRALWAALREISPRSNTTSVMPNTIKTGDFETSNPIDIAQTFNQVFSTIADTYVPCDNHEQHHNFQTLDEHVRSKLAQNTKFVIPDVTHEYVLHKLSTQPNRATGADGISAKLIKISASHIAAPLSWIINLSLRTGVMPATWKHARVSPIYKTGDKAECGNYRPISVLCGISKVIERHVHDALYTYLTQHSLLFAAQSGFRPRHSCETALLRMIDLWAAAIDRGDINGVILLDFRKAFDLINHECLLKKLDIYQCDDNANTWFRSYLTGRTQQTSFRGHLSETAAITAGVPQGSIIGPLLFIVYMNDLPLHIHNDIDMFADDSTLHTSGANIEEIQLSLQTDLNVITTWCTDNKMVINTSKTKTMLITTKQRRHHLQNDRLNITLNELNLQQVSQQKVIGVVVDENLKWREHVNGVYKKISQTLALF